MTEDRIFITTPMLGLSLYIGGLGLPKIKEIGRNIWSVNAQEYYVDANGTSTVGGAQFKQKLIATFPNAVGRSIAAATPYGAFGYDCTLQMLLGFDRVLKNGGVSVGNLTQQLAGPALKPKGESTIASDYNQGAVLTSSFCLQHLRTLPLLPTFISQPPKPKLYSWMHLVTELDDTNSHRLQTVEWHGKP